MSPSDEPPKNKNPWAQIGRITQLAFVLPAASVAGWLLGAALDRWLHTSWISIIGLVLGSIGGLIEVIRTVSSSDPK